MKTITSDGGGEGLGLIQCITGDSIIDNKEMHENRVLRKRKDVGNTNFLTSPPVTTFAQKRHCLSSLLSSGHGKNS